MNDKRKRYRVQRVLCKRCGDVVKYGEGTGVSPFELHWAEEMENKWLDCNCGYVWLMPFAERERDRILVNHQPYITIKPDDVVDLSEEWKEQDVTYEIWLTDNYSYFDHGIAHFDDEQTVPLKQYVHNRTYGPDSVLIGESKTEFVPRVRYFLRTNMLEFYDVDKNTPELLLHNESNTKLQIGKIAAVPPGASARVDLRWGSMSKDEDKEGRWLKVCAFKCKRCGTILKREYLNPNTPGGPLMTCSCGYLALDPDPIVWRILGEAAFDDVEIENLCEVADE